MEINYKIWIFNSNVISIRYHSDFDLVLAVEKEDLITCKLLNISVVFGLLQQTTYDEKKNERNLLIL